MMKGRSVVSLFMTIAVCSCGPVAKVPIQSGKNTRADVVTSLKQSGVDLKSPVQFELYLYFKDQERANAAANDMRSYCQSVEVHPEPNGERWLCQGHKLLVPDSEETESTFYRAKQAASNHNGEFDGWEIDFGR